MTKKVLVLGGTGMLGAMVTNVLAQASDIAVAATRRKENQPVPAELPVQWRTFDAATADVPACSAALVDVDWVINCIGITKPLITGREPVGVENAVRINSLFPHVLARAAANEDAHVLQIATDCVYSGVKGRYKEADVHDALDVYGKTKSLGEVISPVMHHLRASIIGPEPRDHKFLLDWFLGQAKAATVNGFTNHDWNGVTTLQFARVALGIVRSGIKLPLVQHLVPTSCITKAGMLEAFGKCFGRLDIKVNRVEAATTIDRTLATADATMNNALWNAAGYPNPPTVDEMIEELAGYSACFVQSVAA